jgi:hypothetical protein
LSDRWIEESELLLERMKKLSSKEKRDRLEIINSILLNLDILERSLRGWKVWVKNLSLMSHFTGEELKEIETSLEKQIQPFIEYDIEATRKWQSKFPQIQIVPRRTEQKEKTRGMYV